jgi:hypothetical protein
MSPDDVDPPVEEPWTAEIERRAREVAEGQVTLLDADEVHAKAARLLRARAGHRLPLSTRDRGKL